MGGFREKEHQNLFWNFGVSIFGDQLIDESLKFLNGRIVFE